MKNYVVISDDPFTGHEIMVYPRLLDATRAARTKQEIAGLSSFVFEEKDCHLKLICEYHQDT